MGIWLYGFMGFWAKCWVSVRTEVEWALKAGYPQDLYGYKSTCVAKNLDIPDKINFSIVPRSKRRYFSTVCACTKNMKIGTNQVWHINNEQTSHQYDNIWNHVYKAVYCKKKSIPQLLSFKWNRAAFHWNSTSERAFDNSLAIFSTENRSS